MPCLRSLTAQSGDLLKVVIKYVKGLNRVSGWFNEVEGRNVVGQVGW